MENMTVNDDLCFCCGVKNERGLKLKYAYPEKGKAETECKIPDYFTGWRSITHGGLLAMLLDETMAHACVSADLFLVTAEINVRYLKPVGVGELVKIKAKMTEIKSRTAETEGWIYNSKEEVIARGKARFIKA